jgi:hypothetical protein
VPVPMSTARMCIAHLHQDYIRDEG